MNFTTVEVVIDNLIRKFKLREWQYDIEEQIEDIAMALRHIGSAKQYEEKVAVLTVNNRVAPIPKDCQNVKHLDPLSTPYTQSGSFLQIDVEDGTQINLIYQAMPLDARGYPLVPDNASVQEAIMWYLVKTLVLQGEIKTIGYDLAEAEWQWRCGSARADLNAPTLNTWNKVANDYTRLNPIKDAYEKNLEELGKPNRTLNRDKFMN